MEEVFRGGGRHDWCESATHHGTPGRVCLGWTLRSVRPDNVNKTPGRSPDGQDGSLKRSLQPKPGQLTNSERNVTVGAKSNTQSG